MYIFFDIIYVITLIMSLIVTIMFIIKYIKFKNSSTNSSTTNTIYFTNPASLPAPLQMYILSIDTIFNLKLDMINEQYLLYKINQLTRNMLTINNNDKLTNNKGSGTDIKIWKIICEKRKWKFLQD